MRRNVEEDSAAARVWLHTQKQALLDSLPKKTSICQEISSSDKL